MENSLSSNNTVPKAPQPLRLLIVEDSLADAYLLKEAFAEGSGSYRLDHAENVTEALRLLDTMTQNERCPDVIIIDINLPGKNGFELLAALQTNPHWQHIPAVMLSGSADERERTRSKRLAAACYLIKPASFEGYANIVDDIRALAKSLRCAASVSAR